jgi:hypothetical protein
VGPTGYDDTPLYQWNADFSLEDFKLELDRFNGKETEAFLSNIQYLRLRNLQLNQGKFELSWIEPSSFDKLTLPGLYQYAGEGKVVQRISYASTLSAILSSKADTRLYLFIPPSFVQFANGLIHEALREQGLDSEQPHVQTLLGPEVHPNWTRTGWIPTLWRIDSVCCWQQIDRRIDEYARLYLSRRLQITVTHTVLWWNRVHEVLWAFYRSHDSLQGRGFGATHRFYTEISRRAIRPTPTDEFGSFTRWVLRSPVPIGYSCAVGQGFWGWGDDDYDEGESTDDQD